MKRSLMIALLLSVCSGAALAEDWTGACVGQKTKGLTVYEQPYDNPSVRKQVLSTGWTQQTYWVTAQRGNWVRLATTPGFDSPPRPEGVFVGWVKLNKLKAWPPRNCN